MTTVGVVGAGTMGAGIAQVALEAGDHVVIHDVAPGAVERAATRVRDGLAKHAARRGIAPTDLSSWLDERMSRLTVAPSLDALARGSEVVIEAALEDLDAKRSIFGVLAEAAPSDALMASNTSALSIDAIADGVPGPDRVLGLHFFNPTPRMALVEVVVGARTAPDVADRATALVRSWGKTPVRSLDRPGFIVNRVNRPFTIGALRMLEAGEASVEGIDAGVRAAGYPMGPFELMDLVGIDVNFAAARGVWEGLGRPDRLRPSPIQERLVANGRLGRKTGEGFYRYGDDGARIGPATEFGVARPDAHAHARTVERLETAILAEARRALAEGVATEADIDLALRLGAGHPMGPFERLAASRGIRSAP